MSPYEKSKFGDQKRIRSGTYLKCLSCKRDFYVTPSRVRQVQKHGHAIKYCSQACYKKFGENNPFFGMKHSEDAIRKMRESPTRPRFRADETNPNFTRYGADYAHRGAFPLRHKLVERAAGKCERCQFAITHILQIHHKNRNRLDNSMGNLELLCPNCHAADHYEAKDGLYRMLA